MHTDVENTSEQPIQPIGGLTDEDAAALAQGSGPTDEQVGALAEELAQTAQQYASAEDAERRQETDPDEDIFSGPYDPAQAVQAMVEVNREVIAAKAEWEQSKQETANFKKVFDEAVGRLIRVCSRFDALRRRSPDDQPFLRPVDDETIEHRRRRLSPALVARQCYATPEQLEPLTREELDTLDHWIERPGPIPPELLAKKAHVAGDAGTDGACCTKCGFVLGCIDDQTDYPAGAFVGFDCVGVDLDDARPTARRNSPKGRRRDPETESTKQNSDGAKRSARKSK